jgi:hypothetical protein
MLAGAALAQDDGGVLRTFGINSSLRSDSNLGLRSPSKGHSTALDTGLTFGLRSQTRIQTLALNLAGTFRLADTPDGQTSSLESPELDFSYDREGANSRLGLSASWQETDLDLLSPDADPLVILDPDTGEILVAADTGRREAVNLAFHVETGIEGPLGLSLDARHLERRYHDSVDPRLSDSRTDNVSGEVRLAFSPVLEGRFRLYHQRFRAEDDDDTRRDTDTAVASLAYDLDAATRIEASLGNSRVKTEKISGSDEEQGLTASLELIRDLPRGSIGIGWDRTVLASGPRDTISLSEALDLPRGKLSFRLGASRGTSGDAVLVGQLDYALTLPRGGLTLGLSRSVSTDTDSNDILSTRASASWQQGLTSLSSLRLDIGYALIEDGGAGTTADREQADITLAYDRQVTEDWIFTAGYEHRLKRVSGIEDAQSNAVFMSLGRSFSIRP